MTDDTKPSAMPTRYKEPLTFAELMFAVSLVMCSLGVWSPWFLATFFVLVLFQEFMSYICKQSEKQ